MTPWACFRRNLSKTVAPVFFLLFVATASLGFGQENVSAKTDAPAANAIQLTFWNIEWFPGHRPNASAGEQAQQAAAVHEELKKLSPIVLGMEEVRDWKAAELAIQPLAGFKVDVCSTFPGRESETDTQQVAIASRLPALSAWSEPWKVGALLLPRGFAFAAYELAPKKVLLVYAVHLKSNRGELSENIAMREEMARQLAQHITAMELVYAKLGELTWVIGGDFNTSLDDPRFAHETTMHTLLDRGFNWCWKDVPLTSRITLPARGKYEGTCFDQILFKGATLQGASVLENSSKASDHRAITALLVPGNSATAPPAKGDAGAGTR